MNVFLNQDEQEAVKNKAQKLARQEAENWAEVGQTVRYHVAYKRHGKGYSVRVFPWNDPPKFYRYGGGFGGAAGSLPRGWKCGGSVQVTL